MTRNNLNPLRGKVTIAMYKVKILQPPQKKDLQLGKPPNKPSKARNHPKVNLQ